MAEDTKTIVLGGGCFWCLEAAFELVPGVVSVESGYAGGEREAPSYEQVSTGLTGHAEVVRVGFNPELVSLPTLFELFFRIHDPTTEDRQGADIGTQYRSIILYADEAQKKAAEAAIREAAPRYARPIVTELEALGAFWPAEDYHQDFYRKNP
ncbi:MAG TPA: peptide-methionine (S)-S-oxide reductase MsrA, partial [Spirochaetales bacterium]|nr:peptide-methionine (S)-S-oxide reductase MsrA [Spirochaetales bacterium]